MVLAGASVPALGRAARSPRSWRDRARCTAASGSTASSWWSRPVSSCSASSRRPWRRRRSASRHRALVPDRDALGQEVERTGELVLGVVPAAGGDEDALRSAPGSDRPRRGGCLRCMTRSAARSHSSARADVAGPFAGGDQPAQTAFDDRELRHVAAADRRQRLVEVGHPFVDSAGEDEHHAERRRGVALEVVVAGASRHVDRLEVLRALHLEIAARQRIVEHDPAPTALVVGLFEQPPSPGDPAPVHRPLAEDPSPEPADRPRGAGRGRRGPPPAGRRRTPSSYAAAAAGVVAGGMGGPTLQLE